MSDTADKLNQGLRSTAGAGLRTRIIVDRIDGKWTWRAPLVASRGIAVCELRPIEPPWYANEASAKQAGERNVRALLPGIEIEQKEPTT